MTIDGYTSAAAAAQRLHLLHERGLATAVAKEGARWRRTLSHARARLENRFIERVLLGRIRRAFDHLDNPALLAQILAELREAYARGLSSTLAMAPTAAPALEPVAEAPAPAAWLYRAEGARQLLIYTAGGGFILPPASAQLHCARRLGELCGTDTLTNNHRMAPEAPFPAAIDDSLALYRWANTTYGSDNIVLAADTAGASVTLGLLLALRDRGEPLPKAVQLFSPWNDLSLSGWSYITKSASNDSPFRMETAAFCARAYLADTPATEPLASAIYADLAGLPPLAIHTSRFDMHFDDALRLVENYNDAGGHAEIRYWDSPRHHLERFDNREADDSLAAAAAFLRRHAGMRGVR